MLFLKFLVKKKKNKKKGNKLDSNLILHSKKQCETVPLLDAPQFPSIVIAGFLCSSSPGAKSIMGSNSDLNLHEFTRMAVLFSTTEPLSPLSSVSCPPCSLPV